MAKRKSGLGRGLDVLLSTSSATKTTPANELKMLPVEQISRGEYQPRTHIDKEALQELADSIKAQGIVQPVVVRPKGSGYELVAGERRWRAAQLAGLDEVPVVIRELDDQATAAVALIENIQRKDLNPVDEARALQRLIDEFGLTHQEVAASVGKSRTAVSNLLRLLELGSVTHQYLIESSLDMGHARALLGLDGKDQDKAARHVVAKGLSVRATERHVKSLLGSGSDAQKKPQSRSSDVIKLEQDLSDKIGAPVRISYNSKGKGKVSIDYNNLDELDGILAHIN